MPHRYPRRFLPLGGRLTFTFREDTSGLPRRQPLLLGLGPTPPQLPRRLLARHECAHNAPGSGQIPRDDAQNPLWAGVSCRRRGHILVQRENARRRSARIRSHARLRLRMDALLRQRHRWTCNTTKSRVCAPCPALTQPARSTPLKPQWTARISYCCALG